MVTAMVKGSEVEQGNWTVCSQEVPSHLKDLVILYKKLFKVRCKAKERNKTRIDQVTREVEVCLL